jgi:hypothetical protein
MPNTSENTTKEKQSLFQRCSQYCNTIMCYLTINSLSHNIKYKYLCKHYQVPIIGLPLYTRICMINIFSVIMKPVQSSDFPWINSFCSNCIQAFTSIYICTCNDKIIYHHMLYILGFLLWMLLGMWRCSVRKSNTLHLYVTHTTGIPQLKIIPWNVNSILVSTCT